jgi:hypothetical protein
MMKNGTKLVLAAIVMLTAKTLFGQYVCYLDDFPKEKKVKKARHAQVERIDFEVGVTIVVKTKAAVPSKKSIRKNEELAERIVSSLVKEHERVYKTGDLKIVYRAAPNIYVRYDKVTDSYEMIYIPLKQYKVLQEQANQALQWISNALADNTIIGGSL